MNVFFRRRSKSKKSLKDASSASASQVPDVSLELTPGEVAVTDPLHSGPSLLLPGKQDPCYETSIAPDSGMHSAVRI